MTVRIATVFVDLPGIGRDGLRAEVRRDVIQLWTDQVCGKAFTWEEHLPWDAQPLFEMPHLKDVLQSLRAEQKVHRSDPLGQFLRPVVEEMEDASARLDGACVYFARAGEQIKIGWSRQVTRRLAQLQTGNPLPVELLGTIPGGRAKEGRLHALFSRLRLCGEWFTAAPDLLEYIAANRAEGGRP